jgi:hypothetical protein
MSCVVPHPIVSEKPAVRVDDLVEIIRPLVEKPRSSWSIDDVAPFVDVAKNCNCFIVGGCSKESVSLFLTFYKEWEDFLDEHAEVQDVVDPSGRQVNTIRI